MIRATIAVATATAALAGCRVDDLELAGRRCPCVAGWSCNPATDTCERDPTAVDAPVTDGGLDDDALAGTSCLGAPAGALLYGNDFADLIGWLTRGGTWAATDSEAVQSQTSAMAYAYPAGTNGFTAYRTAARMRATIGGTGAMGLVARAQDGNDGRFRCTWTPATGDLQLQWIRNNGPVGGTLGMVHVDLAAVPGYDPAATVTMELKADGAALACCLREVPGASVTGSDTRYPTGAPGLETVSMPAAFDDFRVNGP